MLRKRILPALLAVCMLIALLPSAAFAAENEDSEKVAEIAGVQYESLSEAINHAEAGATVVLLKDTNEWVKVSKNLTLDLGGKTLTGTNLEDNGNGKKERFALTTSAGTVTVKNGEIDGRVNAYDAANLTIDSDVTIQNSYNGEGYDCFGIVVWGDGTSGQKDCKTPELTLNGKVTLKNGGIAISTNGNDMSNAQITINSGAVVSTTKDGAIYLPSGRLVMNGGTVSGPTGIQICAGKADITTEFKLNGGTVTATGTDQRGEKGTGDGLIPDGAAISVVNRNYPNGVPDITINSGTFSAKGDAILAYTWSNGTYSDWEAAKDHVKVMGGTFSSDPSAYLAAGKFITAADEVGYYTVTDSDPGAATIVVKDNTNATVPEDVTLDEAYKTAVEEKTNVEGVAEAVENKKAAIAEKAGVDLTDSTKKIEVDVKVTVSVASVETENDEVTAIVFTASPVATVKENGVEKETNLDVKDMLDGSEITVTLPVPNGMVPKQIKHTFSDNSGVEYFLASGNGGKTFTYDKETGCVTFRITRFSTFEVSAVQTYTPAAPVSTYRVNVTDSENGVITASHVSAAAGSTVTLTAAPAEGYVLKTLTVTDASGKAVALTEKDGKYTFTMPASAVTVAAAFEKGAHTDCPAAKFSDVDVTLWYHEALDYVLNAGMMNGVGGTSFAPNGDLNRAMLVTILWRLAGEPSVNCAMPFTDVPDGVWYTEAVRWAFSTGVVNGMTATTFAPMESITRQQLVTMLYRYAQLKEYDTTMGGMAVREYDDFESIADWALAAVDWAVNAQLMNGRGNNMLVPEGTATRAEAAKLLMVFCKTIVK